MCCTNVLFLIDLSNVTVSKHEYLICWAIVLIYINYLSITRTGLGLAGTD